MQSKTALTLCAHDLGVSTDRPIRAGLRSVNAASDRDSRGGSARGGLGSGLVTLREQFSQALWAHQRDAVETVEAYLSSGQASGAALISMPTGTGKTAVIAGAIAVGVASARGHLLVLAPWSGLVDQLRRDLDVRVWARLGISRPESFPAVSQLPPTPQIDELARVTEPTVFVATIAKMVKVRTELAGDPDRLASCFGNFTAVIVDECHYEPAPAWSAAIRMLQLPTVLLTATPYRNDEKYFEIDPNFRYRYQHVTAENDGILRMPDFVDVPVGADDFVDGVLEFLDRCPRPESRVIIRCADAVSIRESVRHLQERGRTAVGVHEAFKPGETEGLVMHVPNPDECRAQFWVHQFKLIEGIDDPRFRVLAFKDRLGNDRALIQQIGRVLRNPDRSDSDTTAWVLSGADFDVEGSWRNYRVFDERTGEAAATVPFLARRMLEVQPNSVYYDSRFRLPVDLDSPEAWRSFAYPATCRIYRLRQPWSSLGEMASAVVDEWEEDDRDVRTLQYPDERTIVIPYISVSNSDLLLSTSFIEADFGFTVLHATESRLFFLDTEGRTPRALRDNLSREPRAAMGRLLSGRSRFTSVSLDNTDISRRAVRARTIRAAAIQDLAPDLTDYSFVCSVAEGYPPADPDTPVRRYLGVSRSRVRDRRASGRTFAEYRDWISGIEQTLDDEEVEPADTFNRYAQAADVPTDPTPRHLLIPIDPDDEYRRLTDGTYENLELDNCASEVVGGIARLVVNGRQMEARLSWNEVRNRYDLECESLTAMQFRETTGQRRELVAAINADQQLRVVPESDNYLYSNGSFVTLTTPHRTGERYPLLRVLTGVEALKKAESEKGAQPVDGGWAADSVFGVIDRLKTPDDPGPAAKMSGYFPNIDMLLCTDLQVEICDFVARQPDRIAFIHAKVGGGKSRSASVLHDVVAQALKNLLYLQPLGEEIPPHGHWDQPWSPDLSKGSLGRLRTPGKLTSKQMWERAREVITDPNADREVWLVLGAAMSKQAIVKQSRLAQPTSEMIQIYALLQVAWSAVSQCGARLRVFCSP